MLNVLIADDHAIVRTGLKQFLESTGKYQISAEAKTGAETLALVRRKVCDILMLDISLPDLNGLEVLKRIKRERPELPVLIFSMFAEDELAISALNGGAAGYLCKDSPPDQILAALRTVATGSRYVSPGLAEKLLEGSIPAGRKQPHETLSPREMEVLVLLSRGTPLMRIGELLHVSVKTVSTYRSRILEKLQMDSNAELTRYVVEHKLD
ncbi:MAG: response regulator transcription factor [Rhodocyclales bacterium]|nr:response regulator transcription factor [Rhodocyclales bacterium]